MAESLDKVVTLPTDPEDILKRLKSVNDENTVVQNLYPSITKDAGKELEPPGIIMMFMLAIYDYMQHGYPPMIEGMLWMFVPQWVDALIDDKEAADAAKQLLQQVNDDANALVKSKRVEPEGPVENYELYVAARKVADLVFEFVRSDVNTGGIWMQDWGNEQVNPFYNQTDSGLFLEFYYGMPNRLWTPWGEYNFGGSGSDDWRQATPVILERLGATKYQPVKITNMGKIGPVYALHKVDDTELPEPKCREHQNFLKYEVSKEAWENVTQRYNTEHGITITENETE